MPLRKSIGSQASVEIATMNDQVPHVSSLTVEGFRRLKKLELELRPLCVLIGANGCGKTSLLDVFSLLAASASEKLSEKISEQGGLSSILTQGHTSPISLRLVASLHPQMFYDYSLKIAQSGYGHEIRGEALKELSSNKRSFTLIESAPGKIRYSDSDGRGSTLKDPHWKHNPSETTLSQIPGFEPSLEQFRDLILSSQQYTIINTARMSPIRMPQMLRPVNLPGRDGEDLVSCLFSLRETDRSRFEVIEDTLRAAFPSFDRLDFPPVAAGTFALAWRDKKFHHPFYMHQLSEGTLRFLWLATLLQSPGLPAITLIDEPEVSLHPEMLSLLADLFREASLRSQIIVATHSDRLVRFLQPNEVLTMNLTEDGMTEAIWADTLELDEWLKDYSLDQIWSMGQLGARSCESS